MTAPKKVAVLPGDGIGPEVVDAALSVLDAVSTPIELIFGEIGWTCWRRDGDPVPRRTWDLLAAADTCLLGAITSKPPREAEAELDEAVRSRCPRYVSPVIQLRQRLKLFANVRPIENHLGRGRPYRFAVIRENTEGLYAGFDYAGEAVPTAIHELIRAHPSVIESGPTGVGVSLRLTTRYGLARLLRFAFDYAQAHGHRLLTWADKPNVLRSSGNLAREILEEVAVDYPQITAEVQNADAVALWMVRRPERFGVIVAENMFGDVLSDLGAGVMGGLGLAPSGNYGIDGTYFEPVHGSAPHLAGSERANPTAAVLSLAMMLEHLGLRDEAREISRAARSVLRRGEVLTYDLGGSAGTSRAAAALAAARKPNTGAATAAVLAVGDELLSGDVSDTNSADAIRLLRAHGFRTRSCRTVGDAEADIAAAVAELLGHELVVVIGGLGPTSDDRTRSAVATALRSALEYRLEAWTAVCERLFRFGLAVHPDNERQAYFPAASELLPNPNGTAWGSVTEHHGARLVMLPGPPRECLPMLALYLKRVAPAPRTAERTSWRTLGLIESEVAAAVDAVLVDAGEALTAAYRWHYPYVDVALSAGCRDLERRISEALEGYVVSRRGLTAAEELARWPDDIAVALDDQLTYGRASGLLPNVSSATTRIAVHAWDDGPKLPPDQWTGSMAMRSAVTIAGETRTYDLAVPRRGPEVIDFAAEFVAWSVLRALVEQGIADAER